MTYISPLFQTLNAFNGLLVDYQSDLNRPMSTGITQVLGRGLLEVSIRVVAAGTTVLSLVCVTLLSVPQALILNARLLKEGEFRTYSILKANWAFIKVIFNGLIAQGCSIFSPGQVYNEWKMQDKFLRAIAEVLVEVPTSLEELSTELLVRLDRLPDGGARIGDFRNVLAEQLAQSLIRGEISRSDENVVDPDFWDFSFTIFKHSYRNLLLAHYLPQEVAIAMPHYVAPAAYQFEAVNFNARAILDQVVGLAASVLGTNHVSDMQKEFSQHFKRTMVLIRDELRDGGVYTVEEIQQIDEGMYAAILDRAVLRILETATDEKNKLIMMGEIGDLEFSGTQDTHGLYPIFKAIHQDIVLLSGEELMLLKKTLNRRDGMRKPFELEISQHDLNESDEIKRRRFIKKIFQGIVEVRTSTIDKRIMNNYGLGGQDKTNFMEVFETA